MKDMNLRVSTNVIRFWTARSRSGTSSLSQQSDCHDSFLECLHKVSPMKLIRFSLRKTKEEAIRLTSENLLAALTSAAGFVLLIGPLPGSSYSELPTAFDPKKGHSTLTESDSNIKLQPKGSTDMTTLILYRNECT